MAEDDQRRHRHMRRQGPFEAVNEVPANRFGDPKDEEHVDSANFTSGHEVTERVWNEWACALMCASRAENGCCAYQGALGLCDFVPGSSASDPAEGWTHAACTPGFSTAKCAPWSGGKCRGRPKAAAEGLAIWDLVWEDHFDTDSCVVDPGGVRRPNPEFWSSEVGYKRGKELQWYQPENAECLNGELVITARRERQSWEKPQGSQCQVLGWKDQEQDLDNKTCGVCAPPYFQYYNPCDLQQSDGSGPACDCSHSAEFTSASIVTKGKKEFSEGLFELRAKIDTRPGAWASWWAIGDYDQVPWPRNGEIDIMDAFQRMVKASVTHAGESGLPSGAIQHAGARMVDRDWEKYYHTWQLEWDKDFIEIRVDGETLLKLDLKVANPERTSWPNPFVRDKKFFLILSLAVGGHSGGDSALTEFPVTMHVDYLRVFQKRGTT